MKEKHPGKFRFHIPLLFMLLTLALTAAAQKGSSDTAVFVPSIDSIPVAADSAATAPADREATFDGEDEDAEGDAKDDGKEKEKFIRIDSPGWSQDTFPQRKADTRLFRNDDEFWYANATFAKQKKQGK